MKAVHRFSCIASVTKLSSWRECSILQINAFGYVNLYPFSCLIFDDYCKVNGYIYSKYVRTM